MRAIVAAAAVIAIAGAGAGAAHATPTADHPLEDTAGVVSADDAAALETELIAVRTDTGVRFGVMVIKTTGGESIEAYARAHAVEWSTGTNAAALLVLAIKDRKSRLEVSDLLRPSFPDARAQAILDNIRGYLRKADYAGGIRAVMTEVRNGASGIAPDLESPHPQVPAPSDSSPTPAPTPTYTEPSYSEPTYSEPKDHTILYAALGIGGLIVLCAFVWARSRVASRATLTAQGLTYAGRPVWVETLVCIGLILGGLLYVAVILLGSGNSSRGYSSSSSTWSGGGSSGSGGSSSSGGGWSGGGASSSW